MAELLTVLRPQACIGCGACILASYFLQSDESFSLSSSPIRIEQTEGEALFSVSVDERSRSALVPLVSVCPQQCFGLTEKPGQ